MSTFLFSTITTRSLHSCTSKYKLYRTNFLFSPFLYLYLSYRGHIMSSTRQKKSKETTLLRSNNIESLLEKNSL